MSNQTNKLTDLIDSGIREGYTRCSFKNASDKTRMVAKAWDSKADGKYWQSSYPCSHNASLLFSWLQGFCNIVG